MRSGILKKNNKEKNLSRSVMWSENNQTKYYEDDRPASELIDPKITIDNYSQDISEDLSEDISEDISKGQDQLEKSWTDYLALTGFVLGAMSYATSQSRVSSLFFSKRAVGITSVFMLATLNSAYTWAKSFEEEPSAESSDEVVATSEEARKKAHDAEYDLVSQHKMFHG